MARLFRFAISVATSTAIILLLTLGAYALHLWVGGLQWHRDLVLRELVLFPIVVGVVAGIWPSTRLRCTPFVAGATGAVVGLVYGYCVDRVVFARLFLSMGYWEWRVFGPIGWEIDLEVLVCAVVAGICAILLSITARSRLIIATAVILVLTALFVPAPTSDLINHNQELTVAVVIPADATNEPDVRGDLYSSPLDVGSVTNRVLGLLRDNGIRGQYRVAILYRFGRGKQALAVIVLTRPVLSNVQLHQPRGSDVIYVQESEGWKQIPPHVPTLDRSLTLEPLDLKDALGHLVVEGIGLRVAYFGIPK